MVHSSRTPSLFFLILILATACAGCSPPPQPRSGETGPDGRPPGGSLVWDSRLELEVESVAGSPREVSRLVQQAGGFIGGSAVDGEETADFTLRVPADNLEVTLASLEVLGEVRELEVRSLDTGDDMVDLRARLNSALALRGRLETLLERADSIKQVLEIEGELTRISARIDALQARLNRTENQVKYATIQLELRQRRILGPVAQVGKGVGWVVTKLFFIR